jgi:signal transduction histidine kinase
MLTIATMLRARYKELVAAWRQRFAKVLFCLTKTLRESGSCLKAGGAKGPGDENLLHMSRLLDSVATGMISLDGEGRIKVFNAAAETLFSLPRAVILGVPFREAGRILSFSAHAHRAFWERLSDAVWAAGAARDLEFDLTPRNGPRRVISYSVYTLGRPTWSIDKGVVIMFEDITRKKEMEDQISDARKRLQAVFDGITDGIQVVDGDFRITAVNKSMTALLGRTILAGELCFKTCGFGVKLCEDCPAMATFETGFPSFITKRLPSARSVDADTGERVIEVSTFPLLDRGNRVVQVVEYIKDVTDRVRLAERLEHSRRLAELGEMAARVAHEVRNPLNAITGAAHYLSTEYRNDETIGKFTSIINRQATRVNQVASDLLSFSRPMRLRLEDVNINGVLEQVLDSLCEQARSQSITMETDMHADIPLIKADGFQIEQALQNIVRNAIEAMPGGGNLRVTTAVADGDGCVDVLIQDTGQGIPEADKGRIFQSFFTTKTRGTGLGLTIVQRVLKGHGGEIFIEQPVEGGTRVLVRLPVGMGRKDDGRGTMNEGRRKKDDGEHVDQAGIEGKAHIA